MEYQREGNKKIIEHIAWIDSIGVDAVTVTIPFLLQIIKKQFPRLKVKISSFARVNTPRQQNTGRSGALILLFLMRI